MPDAAATRRRFLTYFASVGLSSTLLPGVLWARVQQENAAQVTSAMLKDALAVSGLDFTDEQREQILNGVNQNLTRYAELRQIPIDSNIAPPMYFSPIVPGTRLDRVAKPFRPSAPPSLKRPANLEDVAFWPLAHLAQLLKTRQVTSVELTRMYLDRLSRFNATLNFVVTYTDELAMQQAQQADREIAAGKYRGPLHGMPWGCKDIIAVPGFPTQWGSGAFKGQVIDTEATVVRLLREAGAVMLAKLTTGELASGDQWFGGRTNSPWDPTEGSSGSSAGPASATAAGCVAFGIGTETSGSILSPSTICGVTGLRPTFGRVSRYGAMTLSWTQDRLGPLCRTVEDCALVFHAIARTDEQDLSVIDLPFNWDADLDVRKLRVGYLAAGFQESPRNADWKAQRRAGAGNGEGARHHARGVRAAGDDDKRDRRNSRSGIRRVVRRVHTQRTRQGSDQQGTRQRHASEPPRARGRVSAGAARPRDDHAAVRRGRFEVRRLHRAVHRHEGGRGWKGRRGRRGWRGGRGRTGGAGQAGRGEGAPPPAPPPSAIRDHFQVANLCGYPAVSVPNGFTAEGRPTSITFLGRLYAEAEMLALARAYQERAGFHLKHPRLT